MKAYRMLQWGQRPRLCDIPTPAPGPGEVRLRVGGSGSTIARFPLKRVDEAFEVLRRGAIAGRAVIVTYRESASDALTPAGTPC